MLTSLCILLPLFVFRTTAYAITGVSAGVNNTTGERSFRQEINAFAVSGAAWDLYVLSLRQLQQVNQNDSLSYFQIAGIHGYPHIPWDGVNGTQGMPGYCMHAAVPFPTWHRPYVALFEQVLWNHAQAIARTYPPSQKADYIAAAVTLRVPYWDWAVTPSLPSVVTTRNISINTPAGFQEIDNPLFNYTFQSNAAGNGFPAGDPMANFTWTVRHWNAQTYQSNNTDADADLLANAPTILALTYQLLTIPSNYTSFACTASPGGLTNTANNIENIHNGIHNFVGGNPGHMVYPEVAAFDPVFWLHHANVDRLFAIWQILNPDTWVEPTADTFGTYFESPGFIDTSTSVLAPFHSDNESTMYTSDTSRYTRPFGYTYPELIDWNTSLANLTTSVRARVNELYNPYAGNKTTTVKAVRIASRSANVAETFSSVTFELTKELGVNNLDMQWSINVQLQRYAFPTAFTIHFFVGDPPSDPNSWSAAPNLIGSHGQFIPANASLFYPGDFPAGIQQGEISLTHTLAAGVARGLLADLTPPSVLPLLAQNLNWRVRGADGGEIGVESIADLSIAVGSRQVQLAATVEDFPLYGEMQYYAEATQGKCGGFGGGACYRRS